MLGQAQTAVKMGSQWLMLEGTGVPQRNETDFAWLKSADPGSSIGGLLILRSDARALFDGLTSGAGLAMVIVSAVAGATTLALVWTERYGLARATSALAVVAIVVGWALAQDPYLLPPDLTVDEAAAANAVLQATVIVVGLGMLILAPSLWFLYRLVLRGELDQSYEPLDQRFHT